MLGDAETLAPHLEHLAREVVRLRERDGAVDVLDPAGREEVHFLRERRADHFGRAGDDRARRVVHRVDHEGRHVRDAREEDVVERVARLVKQQIVDVRLAHLRGIARIDRPVLAAFGPELL